MNTTNNTVNVTDPNISNNDVVYGIVLGYTKNTFTDFFTEFKKDKT